MKTLHSDFPLITESGEFFTAKELVNQAFDINDGDVTAGILACRSIALNLPKSFFTPEEDDIMDEELDT